MWPAFRVHRTIQASYQSIVGKGHIDEKFDTQQVVILISKFVEFDSICFHGPTQGTFDQVSIMETQLRASCDGTFRLIAYNLSLLHALSSVSSWLISKWEVLVYNQDVWYMSSLLLQIIADHTLQTNLVFAKFTGNVHRRFVNFVLDSGVCSKLE